MLGIAIALLGIYAATRQRMVWALLVYFFLVTNGAQIVASESLMLGLPIDKPSDLALMYAVCASALIGHDRDSRSSSVPLKAAWFLAAWIVIQALYSYIHLHYELKNIAQVARMYLYIVPMMFIARCRSVDAEGAIVGIIGVSVLLCIAYTMQALTDRQILFTWYGGWGVTENRLDAEFTRFYNLPIFAPAVILSGIALLNSRRRYIAIVAVTIAAVALWYSQNRGAMVAVSIAGLLILLREATAPLKLAVTIAACVVFVVVLPLSSSQRLESAVYDLQYILKNGVSYNDPFALTNTFLFRLAHIQERLEYIMATPNGWAIGVGLISDNSVMAQTFPFEVGLRSAESGLVSKIDSSDLVWSTLILNLGVVGALLFLCIIWQLWKKLSNTASVAGQVGVAYVLYLLLASMTGNELTQTPMIAFLMLLWRVSSSASPKVKGVERSLPTMQGEYAK